MPMENVAVNFNNTQYTSAIGQSALLLTNKHLPSTLQPWPDEDVDAYKEDVAESSSSQSRGDPDSSPMSVLRSNRSAEEDVVSEFDNLQNDYSSLRKKYNFNFADDLTAAATDPGNRSLLLDEPMYATPNNILKLPGDGDTLSPHRNKDDPNLDYLLFPREELESSRFLSSFKDNTR